VDNIRTRRVPDVWARALGILAAVAGMVLIIIAIAAVTVVLALTRSIG